MARSTGRFLLVAGLLVAAALVFWALPGDDDLENPGAGAEAARAGAASPPEATPTPSPRASDPTPRGPRPGAPRGDGVPRVLPPDAAIEDVRDALALPADDPTRARALQDAYDAIARVARDDDHAAAGLRKYVTTVEDPLARAIVLAALGADRDERNLSWLAARLRSAGPAEEQLGALLGLLRAVSKLTVECPTLAGIRHPYGPLPNTPACMQAVAAYLDRAANARATEAWVPLANAVAQSVDVAALLVVGGTRVCALYAEVDDDTRAKLRASALRHAALPGAVRRVLETAK